jgi:hypothetical protein
MALRAYEKTETWPCSRCRVTPVTTRWSDGKMHCCQACKDEIKRLADEFMALFDE